MKHLWQDQLKERGKISKRAFETWINDPANGGWMVVGLVLFCLLYVVWLWS